MRGILMPKLLLEFVNKNTEQKRAINQNLLWFDAKSNKMIKLSGGKLKFEFDIAENKIVPKTEEVHEKISTRSNNKSQIESWINQFSNELGAEVSKEDSSNKGIVIEVDESVRSTVEYSLDCYGIRYSEV